MNPQDSYKLGLIINPIAGMGGSVGLKGTDGKDILKKAINLGAKPSATDRAKELLSKLESIKSKLVFITCPNFMGENVLKELNYVHEVVNDPSFENIQKLYDTASFHTRKAAELMKKIEDLDLIIFVGGDGTARDVLSSVNQDKPCLGIPAGVKIYSSVFAFNPHVASSLIMQYLWEEIPLREAEVLDIDEEEYRKGKLVSKLYGYMLIPYNINYSQSSKLGTPDSDLDNQERIAKRVIENLESDVYYLLGPGTTTKTITDQLRQPKSVLGVDLLYNKQITAQDLNEQQILEHIKDNPTKIIVSLIGRQGFLFGRGNLQFTPKILRLIGSTNIIIISTRYKLQNIPNSIIRLDTRDPLLDGEMRGIYKVIIDYDEIKICSVE